ncbi:POK9 protein, partial [Ptilorrhoa leucosticta]|nr:POK9 protein [Ptilorrhoa leucosticta]
QLLCVSSTFGKLPEERARSPRPDTSSGPSISVSPSLQPATAGSLGLDLAASVETTLATTRPAKIPTGVNGPIVINGQGYGGLVLGRSSASIMGLFVLPGVIDADYTGEIHVMAYTMYPPIVIGAGQRIAQFIPLPQLTSSITPRESCERGKKGFGSSGVALLTMDLSQRPKQKVTITYQGQSINVEALLDTGADASIISPRVWPRRWPTRQSTDLVTGVGGCTLALKTPRVIVTIDGKNITVGLSVIELPVGVSCLIGRDILAQLGVVL